MKKRISNYRRFVLEKNNQSPINKKVEFPKTMLHARGLLLPMLTTFLLQEYAMQGPGNYLVGTYSINTQ